MTNNFLVPKLFVVVLNEVLIARDIEMTIADIHPDARTVVVHAPGEMDLARLEGHVAAAFVQHDLPPAVHRALAARVKDNNGLLVLVGQEQAAAEAGVATLRFPFTQEDVAALIAGLSQA